MAAQQPDRKRPRRDVVGDAARRLDLLARLPGDIRRKVASEYLTDQDRARLRGVRRPLEESDEAVTKSIIGQRKKRRTEAVQAEQKEISTVRKRCREIAACQDDEFMPEFMQGITYIRGARGGAACPADHVPCGAISVDNDDDDEGKAESITCCLNEYMSDHLMSVRMTPAEAADILDDHRMHVVHREVALIRLLAYVAADGRSDLMTAALRMVQRSHPYTTWLDTHLARANEEAAKKGQPQRTISQFLLEPPVEDVWINLWMKLWRYVNDRHALLVLLAFVQLHGGVPVDALARIIRSGKVWSDRSGRARIPDIDEEQLPVARQIFPGIDGLLARLREDIQRRDVRHPNLRRHVRPPARFAPSSSSP